VEPAVIGPRIFTAPDRSRQDDTDDTSRRAALRATVPAKRHGVRSLPSHSPSNSDRSGNSHQAAAAPRIGNCAKPGAAAASRNSCGQQFFYEYRALRRSRVDFARRHRALDPDDYVVNLDGGSRSTQRFTEPPAQPIAVDGPRDCLAADHVANPSRRAQSGRGDQLKEAPIDSAARSKNRFECAGAAKAIVGAAADARRRETGQTESRARPLARRAASTLRPPTVCMRLRNPCFRARRSFEGWNVRFMAVNDLPSKDQAACSGLGSGDAGLVQREI